MMSRTENRLTPTSSATGMAIVTVPRMHYDEVDVDDALVRRLLAAPLPHLSGLPLARIEAWGTDHAIFRLCVKLAFLVPKFVWRAVHGREEGGSARAGMGVTVGADARGSVGRQSARA